MIIKIKSIVLIKSGFINLNTHVYTCIHTHTHTFSEPDEDQATL